MDVKVLEERYMKTIKRCAKLSGIWPEQGKVFKYTMRVITYIIAISCFITLVARIVHFHSVEIFIEEVSFCVAIIGLVCKQGNYIIYSKQYAMLLESIREDWRTKRPEQEIVIMTQYAERGVLFTAVYMTNCIFCSIFFLQMPLTPRILDVVMPKNESRDLAFVYPAYYYVDEHKYYMLISAHMSLTIFAVAYVYIACDTSLMYTVQHACGLFAVSGYRFKTAVEEFSAGEKRSLEKDEIYRKVCHSIEGHQHAIKYLKHIVEAHDSYLFICVFMVMICFSVTLVKVSKMDVSLEMAKDCVFVVVQLIHILYLAIQGQFVINVNEEIAESIYSALWYNGDKRTQLLFVLVLRYCLTPPALTAGGLITLNLQSFTEIIKTSVSYFTVLKST